MEMDLKKIWDTVLVEIELAISKPNFNTWFKDTKIIKFDDGTIYLSVPNNFVQEWLKNKFHNIILKSLRNITTSIHSLHYIVSKDDKILKTMQERPVIITKELPIENFIINKDDNLNPKYTFDNFVVGPFNELAHAASQAIIKKPGIVYNPLFIHGNTGHGKTHLIQAIGNTLKNTGRKVFYTTSEKFGQEYVNAVQNNRPNFFKEKYRKYDVLIMDDIQFLSGRMKTQEELFHLFNHLYENNKQIIFSSDKHPSLIQDLEERLKSRFSAGMIIDIPAPDNESRIAIIKTKASLNNFNLEREIVDFIAFSVTGNIRELEGALNTIICHAQLKNKELTISDVKNLLKNTAKNKKTVSIKDIVKTVSDFYNIEEGLIYEKTRKKEVIKPRQVIMYLLREEFNNSYPSIGEKLGGRDHTTVMHACDKIKEGIDKNQNLADEINQLRSILA